MGCGVRGFDDGCPEKSEAPARAGASSAFPELTRRGAALQDLTAGARQSSQGIGIFWRLPGHFHACYTFAAPQDGFAHLASRFAAPNRKLGVARAEFRYCGPAASAAGGGLPGRRHDSHRTGLPVHGTTCRLGGAGRWRGDDAGQPCGSLGRIWWRGGGCRYGARPPATGHSGEVVGGCRWCVSGDGGVAVAGCTGTGWSGDGRGGFPGASEILSMKFL